MKRFLISQRYITPISFLPLFFISITDNHIWSARVGEMFLLFALFLMIFTWNYVDSMNKWKDDRLKDLVQEVEIYKELCKKFAEKEEKEKYGF